MPRGTPTNTRKRTATRSTATRGQGSRGTTRATTRSTQSRSNTRTQASAGMDDALWQKGLRASMSAVNAMFQIYPPNQRNLARAELAEMLWEASGTRSGGSSRAKTSGTRGSTSGANRTKATTGRSRAKTTGTRNQQSRGNGGGGTATRSRSNTTGATAKRSRGNTGRSRQHAEAGAQSQGGNMGGNQGGGFSDQPNT